MWGGNLGARLSRLSRLSTLQHRHLRQCEGGMLGWDVQSGHAEQQRLAGQARYTVLPGMSEPEAACAKATPSPAPASDCTGSPPIHHCCRTVPAQGRATLALLAYPGISLFLTQMASVFDKGLDVSRHEFDCRMTWNSCKHGSDGCAAQAICRGWVGAVVVTPGQACGSRPTIFSGFVGILTVGLPNARVWT